MDEGQHPITSLFKLFDSCHQCGVAFRVAGERVSDPLFRDFSAGLQTILSRFAYELQSEMRRCENLDLNGPRSYFVKPGDVGFLRREAEKTLDDVLETYEDALQDRMPPHARAMVGRQYRTLREYRDRIEAAGERRSA